MKKIITLMLAVMVTALAFAQTPQTINYQAVARNNSGQALVNQSIKVRLSIVKDNATQYSETRTLTTNALGLFNVVIGSAGATNVVGSLATTDWYYTTSTPVKLKVELDINNSGLFTDMGSQDLNTVPYAITATNAVNALTLQGSPVSSATPQTGQILKWTGTLWKPSPAPSTQSISGPIGVNIPGGQAVFSFYGPTVTVTVDGTQTINAVITAALGTSTAGGGVVLFHIGYQNTAGGNITPFTAYANDDNIVYREAVTAAGSILLPAGTYTIGIAIRNTGTVTMNLNGNINGFVTVQ